MHLQGNLQTYFDALYSLGVIDPVLKSDWNEILKDFKGQSDQVQTAISAINRCPDQVEDVMNELSQYESRTLEFIAMEVARELAEFHSRTTDLH